MLEVVERRDDGPAIHLPLVDLLRAVVKPGRITKADRVRGREQPKVRVRADDAVLVEERELAARLKHSLDHEHHVRPPGVVLIEDERDRALHRPRQQAFAKFRDLLAVLEHDRVLADEVDPAHVAVEVDADQRPVEVRGDLLDVGRLAGAVIALDHDAAVERKAGKDRERRVGIEPVCLVDLRHVFGAFGERRHLHVVGDAESARADLRVRYLVQEVVGGAHGAVIGR